MDVDRGIQCKGLSIELIDVCWNRIDIACACENIKCIVIGSKAIHIYIYTLNI